MVGLDFTAIAGEIVEREDAEARRLIEAGYAEPVKGKKPVETTEDPKAATAETPEGEPPVKKAKRSRGKG